MWAANFVLSPFADSARRRPKSCPTLPRSLPAMCSMHCRRGHAHGRRAPRHAPLPPYRAPATPKRALGSPPTPSLTRCLPFALYAARTRGSASVAMADGASFAAAVFPPLRSTAVQVELAVAFAKPCQARSIASPPSLGRRSTQRRDTAVVAMGTCGQPTTGSLRPSQGHLRVRPGAVVPRRPLPRPRRASYDRQCRAPTPPLLCFATRDIAQEFDLSQGSNCEVYDLDE
jgi:hypothetical protein